jgi:hypothetical protein
VVVDKFKLAQALIQSNLVIPSEPHIDRASTCPWHSVLNLVEWAIEEAWLISKVAAEREEHQLIVHVLLLIHGEHDPVGVAKLTVRVHSIEHCRKSFGEVPKVVGEPDIDCTFLLIWC